MALDRESEFPIRLPKRPELSVGERPLRDGEPLQGRKDRVHPTRAQEINCRDARPSTCSRLDHRLILKPAKRLANRRTADAHLLRQRTRTQHLPGAQIPTNDPLPQMLVDLLAKRAR